jgi:hypothetical protein
MTYNGSIQTDPNRGATNNLGTDGVLKNGDETSLSGNLQLAYAKGTETTETDLKNAGTYRVKASGLTNNLGYKVTFEDGTLVIDKAKLTEVKGEKIYDGNHNLSNGTLTIKGVNGEQSTADKATVTLASKNVVGVDDSGTNSVTNISALTLNSKNNSTTELASNYDLSQGAVNNSVTIKPKALSIIGLTVKDKTFDGTTAAEVSNPGFLDGLVAGESLIHTTTANFNDPNVGSSKPVNVNVELISETTRNGDHRNYSLNHPTNIRASITNPVEPVVPPTPVVPVTPPTKPNVVVTLAAANNNFQLAGAEGQCSADTLEECECESASSPAGEALDGIQICFASSSSAKE